jgi:two-component system nitrate/nitrite response regulator NarL
MDTLRVLIVANDPLARAGLAASLEPCTDLIVVGQVDGNALSERVEVYQPDVVLWDLGWGTSSDVWAENQEALEQISDWPAGPPVAVLLPEAIAAASIRMVGVRGFLLRDVGTDQLRLALLALAVGLTVSDPAIDAVLVSSAPPSRESIPPIDALTPREAEVLRLIAEGLPNKTIAQRLGISEHTVKFHTNALMSKLGAQSRTDAVVRATRLGLIVL